MISIFSFYPFGKVYILEASDEGIQSNSVELKIRRIGHNLCWKTLKNFSFSDGEKQNSTFSVFAWTFFPLGTNTWKEKLRNTPTSIHSVVYYRRCNILFDRHTKFCFRKRREKRIALARVIIFFFLVTLHWCLCIFLYFGRNWKLSVRCNH